LPILLGEARIEEERPGAIEKSSVHPFSDVVLLRSVRHAGLKSNAFAAELCAKVVRGELPTVVCLNRVDTIASEALVLLDAFQEEIGYVALVGHVIRGDESGVLINDRHNVSTTLDAGRLHRSAKVYVDCSPWLGSWMTWVSFRERQSCRLADGAGFTFRWMIIGRIELDGDAFGELFVDDLFQSLCRIVSKPFVPNM
jgi:hypothetical protein